MTLPRDPVAQLWDKGARRLLAQAYATPGAWAATVLAPPTRRQAEYLAALGIDPGAADDVPGGRAKTRWARGFVRSCYWLHRWHYREGEGLRMAQRRHARAESAALMVEVGRVTARGRAVRIRVMPGGAAAYRAVPPARRYTEHDELRAVPGAAGAGAGG